MTRFTRRSFLTRGAHSLVCASAFIASQPWSSHSASAEEFKATSSEIDDWMNGWMIGSTKNVEGPLYLSRFIEPIYFLTQPITWMPNKGQEKDFAQVNVPTGFVTDLASIPRVFYSLLRPDGEYTYAAIVHDYLYRSQSTSREAADQIFKIGMSDFGISPHTITVIYDAVRVGGGSAWENNALLKQQGEKRTLKRFPSDPRTRWSDWKKLPDVFES